MPSISVHAVRSIGLCSVRLPIARVVAENRGCVSNRAVLSRTLVCWVISLCLPNDILGKRLARVRTGWQREGSRLRTRRPASSVRTGPLGRRGFVRTDSDGVRTERQNAGGPLHTAAERPAQVRTKRQNAGDALRTRRPASALRTGPLGRCGFVRTDSHGVRTERQNVGGPLRTAAERPAQARTE